MKIQISAINDNLNSTKSKQWPQYLAVLTASLSAFACGLHFGWSSPTTLILQSPEYPRNITSDDISYIAMVHPLGDIVGAPAAMFVADRIGRKKGILILLVPVFLAWIVIAFAEDVLMFCVGRFLAGFGDGMLFIFYPMYVGEVTEPKVRGVLGCTLSVGMLAGMFMINGFAPFLSIKWTALICSLSPVLVFVTFIWMPESPYFCLMKNRREEAEKSLKFLLRCDVTKNLDVLEKDVQRQMSETGTWRDLIAIDSNRVALLKMIGVRTMQQVSGVSAWGLFTQTIFSGSSTNLSPVTSSLIYLLMQMVVTMIGSFMVDKYGRKPLILISSILCAITLLLGAVFFYFDSVMDLSNLDWVPLAIMIVFVVVYSFGLGTAPTLMLGELFSASIKRKALFLMCVYYALLIAVTIKIFNYLYDYGLYLPFAYFGICCLVSTVVGFWFVPETKGKTLEEIQQEFKGNKVTKKYFFQFYFHLFQS